MTDILFSGVFFLPNQLTILSSSVLVPVLNMAFDLDKKDGFNRIGDYLKGQSVEGYIITAHKLL